MSVADSITSFKQFEGDTDLRVSLGPVRGVREKTDRQMMMMMMMMMIVMMMIIIMMKIVIMAMVMKKKLMMNPLGFPEHLSAYLRRKTANSQIDLFSCWPPTLRPSGYVELSGAISLFTMVVQTVLQI